MESTQCQDSELATSSSSHSSSNNTVLDRLFDYNTSDIITRPSENNKSGKKKSVPIVILNNSSALIEEARHLSCANISAVKESSKSKKKLKDEKLKDVSILRSKNSKNISKKRERKFRSNRGGPSKKSVEGHQVKKLGSAGTSFSCDPELLQGGWIKDIGLATALSAAAVQGVIVESSPRSWLPESPCTSSNVQHIAAMERANLISYTSDEWESDDNREDHSDSSDDDDPKSQVDFLIEKGTLMYMDGENSALSSDGEESDLETSDGEYDSESDITDVSPLVSAATSPIGLSPVLPRRRNVPTSPLAIHDNSDLYFSSRKNPFIFDIQPHQNSKDHHQEICDTKKEDDEKIKAAEKDATNMELLLQAVIELESRNRKHSKKNTKSRTAIGGHEPMFIHPIRDNPHHIHLNRGHSHKRKNMSFSNEQVSKIDRENRILLKKLMSAHSRHSPIISSSLHHRYQKPSNSSVNRKRHEERIHRENYLLLKKIQEVKPSKEVLADRPPVGTSCGASMRSISQPQVQTPRKETAL